MQNVHCVPVPPVTSYSGWPTKTLDNVDLPDPLVPMMACTSPLLIVRLTPLRICSPVAATEASKFLTSSSTSPCAQNVRTRVLHLCCCLNGRRAKLTGLAFNACACPKAADCIPSCFIACKVGPVVERSQQCDLFLLLKLEVWRNGPNGRNRALHACDPASIMHMEPTCIGTRTMNLVVTHSCISRSPFGMALAEEHFAARLPERRMWHLEA